MYRDLKERAFDVEQLVKGKRFRLDLEREHGDIAYSEKDAISKGVSFCKYEDNGNCFYLSNQGDWSVEKSFYFDTLEELRKYAIAHPLDNVKVYRKKNDFDENDIYFEYEFDSDFNYAYSAVQMLEDEKEEQIALNRDGDEVVYSEVVVVDKE